MMASPRRHLVIKIAEETHKQVMLMTNNEPLDGDHVEELSIMIREELDLLNGNMGVEDWEELTGLTR